MNQELFSKRVSHLGLMARIDATLAEAARLGYIKRDSEEADSMAVTLCDRLGPDAAMTMMAREYEMRRQQNG